MASDNLPGEKWLDIPGFEGLYEVSNLGRVRNFTTGRILKQNLSGSQMNALKVGLYKNGSRYPKLVRRLVARAFVPKPRGTPKQDKVIPINGDHFDNRAENLCWASMSEVGVIAVDRGRNEKANRKRCPRGHLLAAPNLVRSKPNGGRECLACDRESSRSRYNGTKFSKQIADKYYDAIMQTVPKPTEQ